MENNKHVKTKDNMTSVHFDSLLAMMEYVNGDSIKDKRLRSEAQYNMKTRKSSGYDWYGKTNRTSGDVLNHALLGDKELYKALEHKMNVVEKRLRNTPSSYANTIKQVKRVKVTGDFGDELDIHKVYQGQCATAWSRTKRVEMDSKFNLINIVVDLCAWGSQTVDDTLWRAAIAVKVVNQLVTAGKSVKLSVGFAVENPFVRNNGKEILTSTVTIKNYNEQISLERVAAMCNVSFFRSALFASYYVPERRITGSKGRVISITPEVMPLHLKEDIEAGHAKYVVVPQSSSEREALNALDAIYKQIENFSKGGN